MTDLLNLGGDERLDFGDLTYALNQVPAGLLGELTGSFLVPTGTSTIISGFAPSGSGQGPVQVGAVGVPNLALLGQRVAGAISQGVFSAVGPQTINLSVASLPANTYGVYVRFNRLPGAAQTRKFWSKASPGSEYAQLADTRLVAAWEARLETTQPSAEWLLVGQAVVTAAGSGQGNTVAVIDQRPLFFEGTPGGGYAPVWGSAADRATDRRSSTIFSLQQELDALRQCIVDIKGRGLATWFQPNISGMQVGTAWGLTSTPTANTITLGDAGFYLGWTAGSQANVPTLAFDGTNDYLQHDRVNGILSRYRAGAQVFQLNRIGGVAIGTNISTPSFVAINPGSLTTGHGLAVQTTQSGVMSTLGLLATQATSSYIEFGPSFNSLYGFLRTQWSTAPIMTFGVASTTWLTSAAPGSSGGPPDITFSGRSLNVNTTSGGVFFNNRQYIPGVQIWAAGTYVGNNTISTLAGVSGLSCTANYSQDAGGHYTILLTFNQNLPASAIVNVSGKYDETVPGRAGKVYQTSWIVENSTQIRVGCANANNDPEDNGFSFMILYGT